MEVRSIETIVRALNDAQVQYLIVGGLAVNAHGFVRFTRDVDLVLGLEPANAERGLNALLQAGWQLAIPERAFGVKSWTTALGLYRRLFMVR